MYKDKDGKPEVTYRKSNREERMTPKKTLYWCNGCDMVLVNPATKCRVCGRREKRRLKKEPSTNGR